MGVQISNFKKDDQKGDQQQQQYYFQMKDGQQKKEEKKQRFSSSNLFKCVPNLNCLDAQFKGKNNWYLHLKFLIKQKYKTQEWALQIDMAAKEKIQPNFDEQNLKELHEEAKRVNLESQQKFPQDISFDEQDQIIAELIQKTEILQETLQEQRVLSKNSKLAIYTHQNNLNKQTQSLIINSGDLKRKNFEIYINICLYQIITKIIDEQLRNSEHPLEVIKNKFIEYIFFNYNDQTSSKPIFWKLQEEIKQFIQFWLEVIRVYYQIDELVNDLSQNNTNSFINNENLSNFLYMLLFQNQGFYQKVFKFFADQELEMSEKLKEKYLSLSQAKPNVFGITDEFCLDENTLKKYRIGINGTNQQQQQTDDQLKQLQEDEYTVKKDFQQPYIQAIQMMSQIKQLRAPVQKVKLLIKISQILNENIKQFYNAHNLSGLEKIYDADNILSLFIYIIVKSSIIDILAQLRFIQAFNAKSSAFSISEYILITLEGGIQHIISINANNGVDHQQ